MPVRRADLLASQCAALCVGSQEARAGHRRPHACQAGPATEAQLRRRGPLDLSLVQRQRPHALCRRAFGRSSASSLRGQARDRGAQSHDQAHAGGPLQHRLELPRDVQRQSGHAGLAAYGLQWEVCLSFAQAARTSTTRPGPACWPSYIVANAVRFPVDATKRELPGLFAMTASLDQRAGCPFEWAFLLFLPVLGVACAKARLFINEFFLVPPLLWLGLCLDSGANKSGVMTAMADIVSGVQWESQDKKIACAPFPGEFPPMLGRMTRHFGVRRRTVLRQKGSD